MAIFLELRALKGLISPMASIRRKRKVTLGNSALSDLPLGVLIGF